MAQPPSKRLRSALALRGVNESNLRRILALLADDEVLFQAIPVAKFETTPKANSEAQRPSGPGASKFTSLSISINPGPSWARARKIKFHISLANFAPFDCKIKFQLQISPPSIANFTFRISNFGYFCFRVLLGMEGELSEADGACCDQGQIPAPVLAYLAATHDGASVPVASGALQRWFAVCRFSVRRLPGAIPRCPRSAAQHSCESLAHGALHRRNRSWECAAA